MSTSPDSKNYYFYLQHFSCEIDEKKLIDVLKNLKVKCPKYKIGKELFWLCLDVPFNLPILDVVQTVKKEFGIEEDELVQTVSDFEHIDKIFKLIGII